MVRNNSGWRRQGGAAEEEKKKELEEGQTDQFLEPHPRFGIYYIVKGLTRRTPDSPKKTRENTQEPKTQGGKNQSELSPKSIL